MGDFSHYGRTKPEWKHWKHVKRKGKRWTYMYTDIQGGLHYYQPDDSWVDEWFSDAERRHIIEHRMESYLYYGEGTDMCVEYTIVMDISKVAFMRDDKAERKEGLTLKGSGKGVKKVGRR